MNRVNSLNFLHKKRLKFASLVAGFQRVLVAGKNAENGFAMNDNELPFLRKQLLAMQPIRFEFFL